MTASPEQIAALVAAAQSVSVAATHLNETDAAADAAQEAVDESMTELAHAQFDYDSAKADLSVAKTSLDEAVAAIVG